MFALVLPDLGEAACDRPYTYLIPPHLSGVTVGGRVLVTLGARQVAGYVLGVVTETDVPPEKLRPILAVQSSRPAFTPEQAALAQWLAAYFLCPVSEALRPCLAEPGELTGKRRWQCVDGSAVTTLLPDKTTNAVLAYLREHPGASATQVRAYFGAGATTALDTLRRDNLIRPAGVERAKAREINAVTLALPPADLHALADKLPKRAAKQAEVLRWSSCNLPAITGEEGHAPRTVPDVAKACNVSDAVVRACVEKGWLQLMRVAVRRNPWELVEGRKAVPPTLTEPQQAAVTAIIEAGQAREAASFLLFGVTGSGKTEVFLHAIAETLARGRQAIVLVPEISLTAQAMALYHGRFPGQVAVLHSHLSTGERFDEWQRIQSGAAQVVLGARSAIFAPCPDVGIIIIDEEHESSYKQESSPRYHARGVALERGRLCGAPVVLASATPSLESMRAAELGRHTLLALPERIAARPLPPVRLVDLRKMTKNARILSHPLRLAITERLERSEQVILFLNRRGYAYSLLCPECGYQEECPECAVPLAYHKHAQILRCHHCDHVKRPGAACPQCKGTRIAYRGVGTERLEQEVAEAWPQARIGRMDRDTTARKGAHHAILGQFEREELDILIGTQMVAKGLDFPRVTLVGVIAADTSLGIPDFRAPERTFQLLTQVAGRAGRAEHAGEVIIQTFRPEHYAICAAAQHDYETFYRQELRERGDSEACWPPLAVLVNIIVNGEREEDVKATAAALARRAREAGGAKGLTLPPLPATAALPGFVEFLRDDPEELPDPDPFGAEALLQRDVPEVLVSDGVPCPLPRLRGRYRYHVELRGQDPIALRAIARDLQSLTPPKGVQVIVDVDPLTLA